MHYLRRKHRGHQGFVWNEKASRAGGNVSPRTERKLDRRNGIFLAALKRLPLIPAILIFGRKLHSDWT
jgi:hypothetical protein